MPINGIETAYKDRYTFAPPSKRQIKAGSVVHFASAIYTATRDRVMPPPRGLILLRRVHLQLQQSVREKA